MKTLLYLLLLILATSNCSRAQVHDGIPYQSTIIRFSNGMPNFIPDTSTTPLWQIGCTNKAFFAGDTTGNCGMVTDTQHHYPVIANNWFVLKVINNYGGLIIDFWHKYQTDSLHDGGIVEFSVDHGTTWQNVKGACNVDSFGGRWPGTLTSNFYSFNDTLNDGEPAFSGAADSSQYSRFQFWQGPAAKKGTSGSGCNFPLDTIFVRFRFVSDSIADTLSGWLIDSIKIEVDFYSSGSVTGINNKTLDIFPNPSTNNSFNFPAIENEQDYHLEIYNTIGAKVKGIPYSHSLNLSEFPKGLYFYRVTNGVDSYSGQLLLE